MLPSIFYLLCLWTLFLNYTNAGRFELNLDDVSGKSAKIACAEVGKEPLQNGDSKREILWQGSKFGPSERDILRSKLGGKEVLVPDIILNAGRRYRCALMSANAQHDKKSLRQRIHRALSASVPAEYGTCKPGYRLDQDRCYPCPPGSYTSGQETRCYQCPKDFYSSWEGSASCQSCPEGTHTAGTGADRESWCLDENGKPAKSSKTVWIIVGVCALIFMVTVWILIAIYLLFWKKDDKGVNVAERLLEKGGLKKDDTYDPFDDSFEDFSDEHIYEEVPEEHIYENAPNHLYENDNRKENIYDEVAGDEDDYEVPNQPKKDHRYVNTRPKEVNQNQKQKQRKTSSQVLRQLPPAPPLPTKETDKKKIKERERKMKEEQKKKEALEAKLKKEQKKEAAKKEEQRRKAAKAFKAAKAEAAKKGKPLNIERVDDPGEARKKVEDSKKKEQDPRKNMAAALNEALKKRAAKKVEEDSDEHIYEEID